MQNYAAFFGGQGSQYPGMGKSLCGDYALARQVYECAAEIFGFDVAKASIESDEAQLAQTGVAQPAIFTLSAAAYLCALEEVPAPACVAGHSFGEYAALFAAGAYSLEDGFRIVKARAEAMQEAVDGDGGAMFAVMGADEDAILNACGQAGGMAMPVNFNTPGQVVIAGETGPVTRAAAILGEQGVKTVKLAVSRAFHTPLMRSAAERLRGEIGGIAFHKTAIPFYSNLTGGLLDVEDYPEYFAKHMVAPVLFTRQCGAIADTGVTVCAEFGPKKTAVTLAKKNIKSFSALGVEDRDGIEKLKAALQAAE